MGNDNRSSRVMETASATTSPDNSNSGSFAYIITAVALGLLLMVSLAGAGCASVMISAAADDPSSYGYTSPLYDYDTYGDDYDDMDWEDFLQYYNETYGDGGLDINTDEGTATVADVLDYDIAPYGLTLDDEVSASAYAGVSSEVRDFVRLLVKTDEDYAVQVVNLLNTAALDEDARTKSITDAIAVCNEASSALDALEIPAIANDENGSVKDALGTAKGKAAQRWMLMSEELELLNTTEEIDTDRLWSKDDEVCEATDEAAELLEEAMSQAYQQQ